MNKSSLSKKTHNIVYLFVRWDKSSCFVASRTINMTKKWSLINIIDHPPQTETEEHAELTRTAPEQRGQGIKHSV